MIGQQRKKFDEFPLFLNRGNNCNYEFFGFLLLLLSDFSSWWSPPQTTSLPGIEGICSVLLICAVTVRVVIIILLFVIFCREVYLLSTRVVIIMTVVLHT